MSNGNDTAGGPRIAFAPKNIESFGPDLIFVKITSTHATTDLTGAAGLLAIGVVAGKGAVYSVALNTDTTDTLVVAVPASSGWGTAALTTALTAASVGTLASVGVFADLTMVAAVAVA